MQYNPLGKTDLRVSRLCLGCMTFGEPDRGNHAWTLPEESSRPIIKRALEGGINFFDTANSYSDGSSEEIVGRALRDFARREDVVVATKVFHRVGDLPEGLSRAQILRSIDDSLRRLGMDYVDILQIHRWDYNTPIEETLEALNDVVKAGKARYIGASSMHASQFAQALELQKQHGWAQFVSMQDHYNLIYREEEREMLPLCYQEGVAVIPWSPLARGRLTRPWGETTARLVSDEVGKNLYKESDENDAQIAERLTDGQRRKQRAVFFCIIAAVHCPKRWYSAPCKGEIPRVQIEDLCEGCISLSNAEGLENGYSTLRTSFSFSRFLP